MPERLLDADGVCKEVRDSGVVLPLGSWYHCFLTYFALMNCLTSSTSCASGSGYSRQDHVASQMPFATYEDGEIPIEQRYGVSELMLAVELVSDLLQISLDCLGST